MTTRELDAELLADALRSVWSDARRLKTLSRIAVHERQFENWWKFELATHLWELAKELGIYVWVEADERADLLLAPAKESTPLTADLSGTPRVPIELKTIGTFWKNPIKAYAETGKKRLNDDLKDARARALAGTATPFAVVALLLTHVGTREDPRMRSFLSEPRALAGACGLTPILDEALSLEESSAETRVCAHQFAWVARRP